MKHKKMKLGANFFHCIVGLSLITSIGAVIYLTSDFLGFLDLQKQLKNACNDAANQEDISSSSSSSSSSCDLFSGRWVFDNVSLPLYEEMNCSFMSPGFACEKYGRKDLKYRNWRWQPHGCDLPRFNGTALLEKIRGKKLVFVGDSMNRNQWTSMLCLIESSLSPSLQKTVVRNENMFLFESNEYNATIGSYWAPFLVESNCDDPSIHRVENRVIKLTGIDKHARHWKDADILIFNNYLWWKDPIMVVWGSSFGSSDASNQAVSTSLRSYEMALDIWSDWLETNINRTKTKMFFTSPSPFHLNGETLEEQRNCYNETEPIFEDRLIGLSIVGDQKMKIAERALRKLGTRGVDLEYLNITHLSEYRKDAHPSIYKNFYRTISEDERSNPSSYSDCYHWCLPGLPDVWNQILYSYIINS